MLIEKEKMEWRRAMIAQWAGGIPELEKVVDAVASGCEPKPRHLAMELGVPVEDIYNRMKRLRRRARDLMVWDH